NPYIYYHSLYFIDFISSYILFIYFFFCVFFSLFFFLMIRRPPRSTLFPTRRSSDLSSRSFSPRTADCRPRSASSSPRSSSRSSRSEEHTSELQSPCNLVCRLLLEKKKYLMLHISSFPWSARIIFSCVLLPICPHIPH